MDQDEATKTAEPVTSTEAAPPEAPAPKTITLPKGDYFEMRTLAREVEIHAAEAKLAMHEHNAIIERAKQRANAKLNALAKEHGFDPSLAYRWDDATCELRVMDQAPSPA